MDYLRELLAEHKLGQSSPAVVTGGQPSNACPKALQAGTLGASGGPLRDPGFGRVTAALSQALEKTPAEVRRILIRKPFELVLSRNPVDAQAAQLGRRAHAHPDLQRLDLGVEG